MKESNGFQVLLVLVVAHITTSSGAGAFPLVALGGVRSVRPDYSAISAEGATLDTELPASSSELIITVADLPESTSQGGKHEPDLYASNSMIGTTDSNSSAIHSEVGTTKTDFSPFSSEVETIGTNLSAASLRVGTTDTGQVAPAANLSTSKAGRPILVAKAGRPILVAKAGRPILVARMITFEDHKSTPQRVRGKQGIPGYLPSGYPTPALLPVFGANDIYQHIEVLLVPETRLGDLILYPDVTVRLQDYEGSVYRVVSEQELQQLQQDGAANQ